MKDLEYLAKQADYALIEYCERVLKGSNNNSPMEQVYKIALAALTAQPVDLSNVDHLLGYQQKWVYMPDVIAAIRAAGYEVKE